ncbi:hypothetical protein D3C74_359480 [compost metagenome]
MSNHIPLNPDAERQCVELLLEYHGTPMHRLYEYPHRDDDSDRYIANAKSLLAKILAVAQPEVNSMGNYLATPRGHYDAWTDTGDGYTQRKGWTLTCLWCGAEFTGATKGEALKGYEAHEEKILQLLRVEDAERAKNRPEVKP